MKQELKSSPNQKSRQALVDTALREASGLEPSWTFDVRNNPFAWLRLHDPAGLRAVAEALAALPARLCTMTAYVEERDAPANRQAVAYHFAFHEVLLTVTVPVYDREADMPLAVPSITPWFLNADWNEREFSEMFGITIDAHPNPKRLFLDERLDAGIMSRLIPFSAMVHGVASRSLWEQVMSAKGVDVSGDKYSTGEPHRVPAGANDQMKKPVEPEFTPVSATEGK